MVGGLERFRDCFADHTPQYALIGGSACDLLMEQVGLSFRATKDLDIVLTAEALDSAFACSSLLQSLMAIRWWQDQASGFFGLVRAHGKLRRD